MDEFELPKAEDRPHAHEKRTLLHVEELPSRPLEQHAVVRPLPKKLLRLAQPQVSDWVPVPEVRRAHWPHRHRVERRREPPSLHLEQSQLLLLHQWSQLQATLDTEHERRVVQTLPPSLERVVV